MIFKYSDNTKSGSGLEEVKRIINFHLNRRPNQGQQKQGQKRKGQEQEEDLRELIERKKAKNNAGKEDGEKGRDRGTGRSGGGNFEETGMEKILAQRSSLCDFGVAEAVGGEQTAGRGAGPGPG